MKYTIGIHVVLAVLVMAGGQASAGTAVSTFIADTGLLTYSYYGGVTANCGRAAVSGPTVTVIPVSSGGTVTATMTLQPSADAGAGIGLIMVDQYGYSVTAVVYSDGLVVLTENYFDRFRTAQFPFPAATNNYLTLEYSASSGRATLTLNGTTSVFLEYALDGAMSVYAGVISGGPGAFSNFSATGPGLPNYATVDTDADTVADDDETVAGTDDQDPGHRPVVDAYGATITALNGAIVVIPAGSLPVCVMNIKVGAAASIPPGAVPGGLMLSDVGLELEPDGTSFSSPVAVTLPYLEADVADLEEETMQVFYHDGADYSATGIAGVAIDHRGNKASFTTTHFTTFVLAGTPWDTDGDGIGDLWEDHWFGDDDGIIEPTDLDLAHELSNYDGDDYSDVQEYNLRDFGFNPLVADGPLPIGAVSALIALVAGLAMVGVRRLRRRTD